MKESDRIAVMVENLPISGSRLRNAPTDGSRRIVPAKSVRSYGDHRIAMSMSMLAISPRPR